MQDRGIVGQCHGALAGKGFHAVHGFGKPGGRHRQFDLVRPSITDDADGGAFAGAGKRSDGRGVDQHLDIAAVAFAAGEFDRIQRWSERQPLGERDTGRHHDLHGISLAARHIGDGQTRYALLVVLVHRRLQHLARCGTLHAGQHTAHDPIADILIDRELLSGRGRGSRVGICRRWGGGRGGLLCEGHNWQHRQQAGIQGEPCEISQHVDLPHSRVNLAIAG